MKNNAKHALRITAALMTVLLLCAGCSTGKALPRLSEVGFYLDTVITLTAYTEDGQVLKDAMAECERYEKLLSRTAEGSDVWRINHAGGEPTEVSADTMAILRCAEEISRLSGGAFDITIAAVSTLWDFTSGEKKLPDPEKLAGAAEQVDYTRVQLEGNSVWLPSGMMIDLGGIAKGYIADRIADFLRERGVKHAILSFGGNIVCIGGKPDGTPWKVGIQDIDGATGVPMMISRCREGSTVTSGTYERCFELEGIRYHHLLSPDTGMPVRNGLASVTIFSKGSMEGDALSTAAFILGKEKGMALIEGLPDTEAVFISEDRETAFTSGAAEWIESPEAQR